MKWFGMLDAAVGRHPAVEARLDIGFDGRNGDRNRLHEGGFGNQFIGKAVTDGKLKLALQIEADVIGKTRIFRKRLQAEECRLRIDGVHRLGENLLAHRLFKAWLEPIGKGMAGMNDRLDDDRRRLADRGFKLIGKRERGIGENLELRIDGGRNKEVLVGEDRLAMIYGNVVNWRLINGRNRLFHDRRGRLENRLDMLRHGPVGRNRLDGDVARRRIVLLEGAQKLVF